MVLAAVGQICSTASMAHNLAQCQKLVTKAVAAGAKALFLPEASDYIAPSPTASLSLCVPATSSPFVTGLQDLARTHSLPINVGIHEPTLPRSNRLRNTLIWIDDTGHISHRYQKLHLFDIDLSRSGGPVIRESDFTEPGNRVEDTYEPTRNFGDVGSLICFDVRFVEPALRLRRMGADVIVYPSAFTVPTGKLHWEALLRCRAIETQCWVVAAAQVGKHHGGDGTRVSYGGTMVVDPNGVIRGRLGNVEDGEKEVEGSWEPEVLVVDLDLGLVEEVRKGVPVGDLRRYDVYPQI